MTIAVILSAHGSVSEKLLHTTEMIVGKQENVAWINLLPSENTDTLIEKYNTQLSNLDINSGVLFLTDIWGGTPFNAAQQLILNHKNYDIITGMNIPMLIEVFIAREHTHTIKKLVHIALQSGSESIKAVKNSLFSPDTKNLKKTSISTNQHNKHFNKNDKNNMTICLIRIDDRLIHGQVVTRWAKEYKINRIIVVNDEIATDEIRKDLLTQVTPPGITAHVISVNKAIRVYNNPKYAKDKIIMLFSNPTDVVRLIEGGSVPIKSVNVGGMSFSTGKQQIHNAVSVNSIDIKAFKKLDQLGIHLEIRKVPSDSPINLIKLIENIT
ncbi:PTS system mannose-specific EIIAB component [Candidatus Blochmanniella vafra str. BVAF]|uniref:PTS system mannose-specific EIIAB component n=1 Tax=Blochmanniella vafra (strain BVAF) TaxID=859654 RepID=E8Q711_BLOVB|nr:PTS mannose transporter subunit IIAB [Candidatus Blochmannia vafer]ADV33835.1 PTS system mannose-specific EIIAB component [Candidatus Blochmannia vafer str. BVAF]